MVGIIVHKEFLGCIQLMEKVYAERKWKEIHIAGTANKTRSEVAIHIMFKSSGLILPGQVVKFPGKIPQA